MGGKVFHKSQSIPIGTLSSGWYLLYLLKLPAPPPCLSPKVSYIKHHDAQRRCHVIAKVEIIMFHPALPSQHFVSPMPAKTLLAAISEEGDVRIEWFEKW